MCLHKSVTLSLMHHVGFNRFAGVFVIAVSSCLGQYGQADANTISGNTATSTATSPSASVTPNTSGPPGGGGGGGSGDTNPPGLPPDFGVPGQMGLVPSAANPIAPIAEARSGTLGNVHVEGGPAGFGIPAHFSVSPNTGSANYSVPIDIPPGVAGMQPKLSLQYNSANGNGQVGVGWSISGLSEIVRCPQTLATNQVAGGVNDDANDRFCLDGQQLLATPTTIGGSSIGAYGANGTHYAKEIDDLSEIISHNSEPRVYSPDWFEVHTKSGLTLEYGNVATSSQSQFNTETPAGPVVEVWALDKVTDKSSNSMVIYYNIDHGILYPSQINYAGATNHMSFGWQTRNDMPVNYAAGTAHQTLNRLQSIKTYAGNTLVADYELSYQYGNSTQRSELTTITKRDGASPQNALPPLSFTWSDAQIDVQPDLITSIANGFGASTNITYLPETSPTVSYLPGGAPYPQAPTAPPISIVSSIQYNVPTTSFASGGVLQNSNTIYSNQYFYVTPVADLTGRGYLGYNLSYETDPQTGIELSDLFNMYFPLNGDPAYVHMQRAHVGDCTTNGNCYETFANTYSLRSSAQNSTFPYLSQVVETRNDLVAGANFNNPSIGAAFPSTTETFSYDTSGPSNSTWGNLAQKIVTTSDGYSTTTNNSYQAANTSAWLIDLLSQTQVAASGINQSSQTRTSSFTYDGDGRLATATIEPGNAANITSMTTYGYDGFGNVSSQSISGSDLTSNVTTGATYDSIGQFPVKITNAIGQLESTVYDPRFGKITNDKDINSQTTTYSYDTFGRLAKKISPDGTYEAIGYTTCTAQSCIPKAYTSDQTLAADNTTEVVPLHWMNYDAVGREIYTDTESFSGPYSRVVYIYDSNGNLAQQSNPYIGTSTPAITTNIPDELGRFVQINHPDGSVDRTNFRGQTIATTNGLGQTANVYEDGHGNVSWSQDSLGNKLTFTYDGFDQRTKVTDVAGNITSYVYDIRGRAVSGVDPDKGAWTNTYNSLSQLIGTRDAKSQSASMTYDLLGRMTQRLEPDLSSNWTFDTAANGVGDIASETASGPASPSGQAGVTGYTKAYSYDGLGRPSQMMVTQTLPLLGNSSETIAQTFTYDAAGRLSTFSTPWDGFTTNYNSYGYETGETQTATGNALWTATGRDAAGSLTSATYGASAVTQTLNHDPNTERTTAIAATSGGNTLESINYSYDVLGDVINRMTNPTVSEAAPLSEYYTYDGLNRLCTVSTSATGATLAGPTQPCPSQPGGFIGVSTTYNAIGDLTSKSDVGAYSYPPAANPRPHAVQSISGLGSFTYDADGNMLAGNGRTLTYTSFNTVSTATLDGKTVSFAYNPEHDRVAQINPEDLTFYLDNMLVTYASGGTTSTVHTYFLDTDGQKAGEIDRAGVTGTSNGSATIKFYLNDWQNSVSTLTDGSGNVLEADSYDAWGKRRNLNGTPDVNDTISSQTRYGYTNQEHLNDVQLIDLNARLYDPYIATLLTVDPAVANWLDPQTWNAYTYARDNPMRYTDPTGETDAEASGDPTNAPGCGSASCTSTAGVDGGVFGLQIATIHIGYKTTSSSPASSESGSFGSSLGTGPFTDPNLADVGQLEMGQGLVGKYIKNDIVQGFFNSFLGIPIAASIAAGPAGGIIDAVAAEAIAGGAQSALAGPALAGQLSFESASSAFATDGTLSDGALAGAREIIPSSEIGNPAVPDGFSKFSTQTFQSPSGDFQVHFYMNPETSEPFYGLDYKSIFNSGRVGP